MENSIEEDIKIALDKFSDNKDIDSAILIVEKFILGNYILRGGRKNIVKDSLRYILSDYKRALKENEELKQKWDKDTHKLQNALDIANADLYSANQIINEYIDDTIPIQKVKDEKEKLDKKYNELVDKVYKDPLKALTDFQRVVGGQTILNALLKEGET
jgi:hypothetical protein|nr:MAG TPA: hypothetical protein [Caudoviricetes sp.]